MPPFPSLPKLNLSAYPIPTIKTNYWELHHHITKRTQGKWPAFSLVAQCFFNLLPWKVYFTPSLLAFHAQLYSTSFIGPINWVASIQDMIDFLNFCFYRYILLYIIIWLFTFIYIRIPKIFVYSIVAVSQYVSSMYVALVHISPP